MNTEQTSENIFTYTDTRAVFEKDNKTDEENYRLDSIFLRKRDLFMINCILISITSRNFSVDS